MNIIKEAYAAPVKVGESVKIGEQFGFGKLGGQDYTLGGFVQILVPLAFSIAALMVIFYFIIGAFELITSQGDKGHIVSARSKIYHSIIGFILLTALFVIMQYIIPAILGSDTTLKII